MERNWVVVEQILAEQTHGTVHRVNVHDNQQVPALKRTEMKKTGMREFLEFSLPSTVFLPEGGMCCGRGKEGYRHAYLVNKNLGSAVIWTDESLQEHTTSDLVQYLLSIKETFN